MATRNLTVAIGATIDGLQQALSQAVTGLTNFAGQAARLSSQVSASFSAVGASATNLARNLNSNLASAYATADARQRRFDEGLGRLGESIQSAGTSLTKFSAILVAAAGVSFNTYANIDSLHLALKAVSGSATAAAGEFAELREVAKLPGVGLEEAVKGSVRLQAVGFSAKQAKDAILQFGNAIALTGGGKAELTTVTTQLGQMAAKGKVLGNDLRPVIESATAVAPVIKRLFGTIDPEEISGKLKSAGKDSAYFISLLTSELSNLERVSGGPKNAIENFGDGAKIASYNIMKAADASLGLTDKINQLGDFITKVADKFSALSPTAQNAIFAFTGIAAAIGPVLLGIGTVIKLLPTLRTAFALLTGPIGAVAIAVVAAVALIVANWDSIKPVLVSSGMWDAAVGLISSTFETIKSVFSAGTALLKVIWDRFGGWLVAGIQTAFEGVAAVFRFGAGVLTGIFKVLTGIFTLDWRTAMDGLGTIAKSIWNFLIDGFKFMAAAVGRAIAEIFRTFGATSLADKITAGIDKALGKLDGLKGKIKSVRDEAAKTVKVPSVTTAVVSPQAGGSRPNFIGDGLGLDAARDKLKDLKDKIDDLKFRKVKIPIELITEYKNLKDRVDAADDITKPPKVKKAKEPKRLKYSVDRLDNYDLGSIEERYEREEKDTKKDNKGFERLLGLKGKFEQFSKDLAKSVKPIPLDFITPESIAKANADIAKGMKELRIEGAMTDLSTSISESLEGAKEAGAVAMGELVGGLIAGTAGLADLPKVFGGILAGLMKQVGQSMIEFGIAAKALKELIKNPVLAIAAGIGLIALSSVLQASVNSKVGGGGGGGVALANGGMAFGPTSAIIGEGTIGPHATTRSNPEVVAPLSKLKNYMGDGPGSFVASMVVKGSDMLLTVTRAQEDRKNIYGG